MIPEYYAPNLYVLITREGIVDKWHSCHEPSRRIGREGVCGREISLCLLENISPKSGMFREIHFFLIFEESNK